MKKNLGLDMTVDWESNTIKKVTARCEGILVILTNIEGQADALYSAANNIQYYTCYTYGTMVQIETNTGVATIPIESVKESDKILVASESGVRFEPVIAVDLHKVE